MSLGRIAFLATLLLGPGARVTSAATILTDANSRVTADDRNGMTVWRVNETADNVFLSNYYIRIGGTGNERALQDALGTPSIVKNGTNRVSLTYKNDILEAVVIYSLIGGPAGLFESRVNASIALTNLSASSLDLHLFQYSDFDLRFDQSNQRDQIRFLSRGSLIQHREGTDLGLLASVDTAPTHYQSASSFLDFYFKFFLDQDGPTTLNDTPGIGVLFPDPAVDSAFAFQWDRSLASGETFRVGSLFQITTVPEPSSLLLGLVGTAAVLAGGLRSVRARCSSGIGPRE
ncbi:MAG: hypothetical protein SFX72_06625 [Isosphaeraceae bacterium]|nr:hypothetical protein [Isosphaeraceae bacterium]